MLIFLGWRQNQYSRCILREKILPTAYQFKQGKHIGINLREETIISELEGARSEVSGQI